MVKIKWNGDYPHNNDRIWSKDYEFGWSRNFMNGTPQENSIVRKEGFLNAKIDHPKTAGPAPYIILLHGCAGLDGTTRKWATEYGQYFNKLGYGVVTLDSFTTRNVKMVCGHPDGHWGRRRSEDAYSALDYLVETNALGPTDARQRVYLLGRSNGGLATIMAMETMMAKYHRNHFAAGFALVPQCGDKIAAKFYGPLFIFAAGHDDANDSRKCEALTNHQREADHPIIKTIVFRNSYHGFMDHQSIHIFRGWRMAYDPAAASETLKSIAEFLKAFPSVGGLEFK